MSMKTGGKLLQFPGIALVLLLAWVLYPLSQAPPEIPWSTRLTALGIDFIAVTKSHSLLSWIAYFSGKSKYVLARQIQSSLGEKAHLDTVTTRDSKIADVPVRLYRPADAPVFEKLPVIVFFHGGGFVTSSVDGHKPFCLKLCNSTKMAVVSVEYRLAPEHLSPAAYSDCMAVVAALADVDDYGRELGINSQSIAVMGDSAGGNLAAAVSLKWRTTGRDNLRAQVLINPLLQLLTFDFPSHIEMDSPVFTNKDDCLFYASTYFWGSTELAESLRSKSPDLLPEETWRLVVRRLNGEPVEIDLPPENLFPHAKRLLSETSSPLLARNTSGVPPAFIIAAGFDPLRSEAELFERKLRVDGNHVSFFKYENEAHVFHVGVSLPGVPFFLKPLQNPNADDLVERISAFLRQQL